jgi:hypothetical protein
VAEVYYRACASVDRHNRSRQDHLMLERKLETKDWSVGVTLSLFGMCVIDAYHYVAKGCRICDETAARLFEALAEELIYNNYGLGMGTRGQRGCATSPENTHAISTSAHLMPTKRKRKDKHAGVPLRFSLQGRCKVCHAKTSHICSLCKHEQGPEVQSEPWICHEENDGRDCFTKHYRDMHSQNKTFYIYNWVWLVVS